MCNKLGTSQNIYVPLFLLLLSLNHFQAKTVEEQTVLPVPLEEEGTVRGVEHPIQNNVFNAQQLAWLLSTRVRLAEMDFHVGWNMKQL